MVGFNIAGAGGTEDELLAIIDSLSQYGTNCIAFISEADHSSSLSLHSEFDSQTHQFIRHVPRGGYAMGFLVPKHLHQLVRCVRWRNRCGSLKVRAADVDGRAVDLLICGHHGGHLEQINHSLTDLAHLLRKKTRNCSVIVIGDHNIDLLPALGTDPWSNFPDRCKRHQHRREALYAFCNAWGLQIVLPSHCRGAPQGAFRDQASACFSRIPLGGQEEVQLPSLLDYCFTNAVATHSYLHWRGVGDHAASVTIFNIKGKYSLPRQKTTWQCTDYFQCGDWLRENFYRLEGVDDPCEIASLFTECQSLFQEAATTVRTRWRRRIPQRAHQLFQLAAETPSRRASKSSVTKLLRLYIGTGRRLRKRKLAI